MINVKIMLTAEERIELYEKALAKGQPIYLHAAGSSMKPLFPKKCILRIESKDNYQINDIAAIKFNGQILAHRIVAQTKDHVITRGYNRLQNDTPTKIKQIIGVATAVRTGKKEIGLIRIYGCYMVISLLHFVDSIFERFQKAPSAISRWMIKTVFRITIIIEYAIFKILYKTF